MVTLAMRPAFTSSRNCEYSIGACVAWRVLNWLNTVISTSPITSQMTRFFSILFKDLLLVTAKAAEDRASYADFAEHKSSKSPRQTRQRISLRRIAARRCGFLHANASEALLQSRQHLFERNAVKQLHQEDALRLEVLQAKIDRGQGHFCQPRLVDVRYARQVGRDIAEHGIGFRAFQGFYENLVSKIGLEDRYPWYWGDLQQINSNHAPAGPDLLGRDLRPASGRGPEVDHQVAGAEQLLLGIDFQKLVGSARAVALRPRLAHVGVGDVPAKPLLVRFRH